MKCVLFAKYFQYINKYFFIQRCLDLLSHQMHQQLKLSEHLKYEKKELQHMSCEVRDLEMKLDRRQLQLRAKLTVTTKLKLYFESYNDSLFMPFLYVISDK